MTLSLTATAEATHTPPRIRLDVAESDSANTITSLDLFRDGVPLRFAPIIAGGSAIAYDYDAPFDVPLVYRADGVEAGLTVDWTETWASTAAWTGSGWSVSAGVASSSGVSDTIYRNATGTIGRLIVASPSNCTVQLTDAAGLVLASVLVSPAGTLTVTGSSTAQAVTASGTFTLELSASSVTVSGSTPSAWSVTLPFAGTPTRVRLIGPSGASRQSAFDADGPGGIAVNSGGDVFVVDATNRRIQWFNSSGVLQNTFGSAGSGNGQFNFSDGIPMLAFDASDNLYVVDSGNNRVQKFVLSGGNYVYSSKFGTPGTGNGQFDVPNGIAIDSSGNIWVVDSFNHRVQKFNSSGVYQAQFGSVGTTDGLFDEPFGIGIDSSGNKWVSDSTGRVQKFNSSNVYVTKFTLPDAQGVEVDSSGNVWVTSTGYALFAKYTSAAALVGLYSVGTTGNRPNDIAISGTNLYVTVAVATEQVQKWTTAPGSVDDITTYVKSSTIPVTASDTETLSPTGDFAGVWLMNASNPDLAIIAEADPSSSDDDYFIVATTKTSSGLAANSVQLPIEGSADVVTVATGPRRKETWTLDIGCTTNAARQALLALLADSAAINLRFPETPRWIGLDDGFYAVGDVSTERHGHPEFDPIVVVSLPLTPSRAPAYLPLWQWNWRTLAQTGMTWADVNTTFASWRELLVGPAG